MITSPAKVPTPDEASPDASSATTKATAPAPPTVRSSVA